MMNDVERPLFCAVWGVALTLEDEAADYSCRNPTGDLQMASISESTVVQFSVQRMVCTGCGSEANASCNCGVAYTPKIVRAAEAIKANPEKSNRAIAEEIGADEKTVRKARADQSAPEAAERIGGDGKSYPAPQKPTQPRGPRFEAPREAERIE